MKQGIRLGLLVVLVAPMMFTGCASKSKKQMNAVQAQIGVITEELVRLDQSLQEVRGATAQAQQAQAVHYDQLTQQISTAEDLATQGGIYRTPSGFTLPSLSVQQALKNAGYYQGKIDGKIGSGTKEAIKAFQRDNGLEPDGVVGRMTWAKLKAYLNTK